MTLSVCRSLATCLFAAVAFAVVPACKSSPDAAATVGSMSSFGVELAKIKDSIDGTVKALEAVVATRPEDIKANYDAYAKAVKGLDKQSRVVRDRANEMKIEGDEFFKEWESSEHVSPERRGQLNVAYAKIKDDMALAKEEFAPFLNAAVDIQSYLKLDLSLKGVNSTGELVKKATDSGARVKSRIDAVLTQLNSVRGMLSTKKS